MKSDSNLVPEQAQTNDSSHRFAGKSWLVAAFPALISAVFAVALYSVTLWGTYVYDDVAIVQTDTRVHDPHQWKRLWTTDYFDGGLDNLYRPLVSTSYALEWWLHGDRPWIFHGINILLHALAAATVAEFSRRALRKTSSTNTTAIIAGLLFASHPIHVEAVANIVGRAELTCTTALLVSLIFLYRRPLSTGRVLAVFAMGLIALLCKEQGILAPLLWIFFGWLLTSKPLSGGERKAINLLVLTTTWCWATYLIVREHFLRFEWDRSFMDVTVQPLVASFGIHRILMPVALLGRYTALLLWPQRLSPDYGADVIGSHVHGTDPYLWIGLIAVAIWCAAIVWTWAKNSRFILFCLLSMAVTYGVIGNIVTLIGTNFAERLIYLPSAFFLIIAATLMVRIPPKPRLLLLSVIIGLSTLKTFTAARSWNRPVTLFQAGVKSQPKSIQLHLLLAQEYHNQGDFAAADASIAQVCEIYPKYWRGWYQRTLEAIADGKLDDAEKYLTIAFKLNPNPALAAAEGQLARARAATQPAITARKK